MKEFWNLVFVVPKVCVEEQTNTKHTEFLNKIRIEKMLSKYGNEYKSFAVDRVIWQSASLCVFRYIKFYGSLSRADGEHMKMCCSLRTTSKVDVGTK